MTTNDEHKSEREQGLPELSAGKVPFPGRERLKRGYETIPEEEFVCLCIAEMEGDLTPEQSREIREAAGKHPRLAVIRDLVLSTKLTPPEIVYSGKAQLKRGVFPLRVGIYRAALKVAAAVLIVVSATIAITLNRDQHHIATLSDTENAEAEYATEMYGEIQPLIVPESEPGRLAEAATAEPVADATPAELPTPQEPHPPEVARPQESSSLSAPREALIKALAQPIPEKGTPVLAAVTPVTAAEPRLSAMRLPEPVSDLYYEELKLRDHILIAFRERVLGQGVTEPVPIQGFELADATIAGINTLMGWEIELERGGSERRPAAVTAFRSGLITIDRK